MLGLGVSLSTSGGVSSLLPSDISGLDVWFKVNTGIVGNAGGASDDGDMSDGEDINSWADQSGNSRHASQTNPPKKPHWEADAADFGGLVWPDDTADTHLNMATNVGGDTDNIEADEDFTIMMRIKLTAFDTTGTSTVGDVVIPAGMTIYLPITDITLTTGACIVYTRK